MKIKRYGFQNKIMSVLTEIVLLTSFIITLFFTYSIRNITVEMMVERYENKNQRIMEVFRTYYDGIDQNIDNFIMNEPVQKSLTKAQLNPLDREMVVRALALLGEGTDYYLYIDNKDNLYTQRMLSGRTADIKELWLPYLEGTYSKTKLVWMEDQIFEGSGQYLFAGRYIRPINQNHPPGMLMIRLKQDYLIKQIHIDGEENVSYYLLDAQGNLCFSLGKEEKEGIKNQIIEMTQKQNPESKSIFTRQGGLLTICEDSVSGFQVVSHVPYRVLLSTCYQTLLTVLLFLAVILVLIFVISFKAANWLARPIKEINRCMTEFGSGKEEKRLSLHTNTELDTIGSSYNQMLSQVHELLVEVRDREAELRKSEMNSLLYQMNPHFLYNTLDAIYMLARIHQEKDIMQMIQSLTKLLRINLSNGAEMIPVKEEIAYVKAYMDILKIRNDDLFTYEIQCDENVMQLFIMKLLLQPLVENSIKHGFRNITEGGKIKITVREDEGALDIQVVNNGELISEEKMELINQMSYIPMEKLKWHVPEGNGGYGVSNVIKRLRLHYPGQMEFCFKIENECSVCCIRIGMEALKREG